MLTPERYEYFRDKDDCAEYCQADVNELLAEIDRLSRLVEFEQGWVKATLADNQALSTKLAETEVLLGKTMRKLAVAEDALQQWLAATPTRSDLTYCPINQHQAFVALKALSKIRGENAE